MPKTYPLGSRIFATSKERSSYVSGRLESYNSGELVVGDDREMVDALLKMHPDGDSKIGSGMLEVRVLKGRYGAKRFVIIRLDGTREDFSYKKALRGPGF